MSGVLVYLLFGLVIMLIACYPTSDNIKDSKDYDTFTWLCVGLVALVVWLSWPVLIVVCGLANFFKWWYEL